MNERELQWLSPTERSLPDCSALPASYLIKSLSIKARRFLWGRHVDSRRRLAWTVGAVSDADGPLANVRNYLEQKAVRATLAEIAARTPLRRACELGCGYGRLIMVLREFAPYVKGYEREDHLLEIARSLLPEIDFEQIESLATVSPPSEPYDVAMTFAVLQHLTDEDAREACETLKRLAPCGYVLCVEKIDPFNLTQNTTERERFISRARPISTFETLMKPFQLVSATDLALEPTYPVPRAASCMLFRSDRLASSGR